MSKEKARNRAPFTMHSSSAEGGYHDSLAQFKSGVDVTNMHIDSYEVFGEVSLQGPFSQEHVGGHQRMHQELFSSTTNNARAEAFSIIPSSGQLRIYGADHFGTVRPRAIYYRDEFAKRPLNIRNIATTTGSIAIGNFSHNYEVVQTVGRSTNPRHFAESVESYQQFQESKGHEGNVIHSSNDTHSLRDFALPNRTTHKSVIVSRFSAPGDRYTMSRGFLEPSGEELSVYNALPYRNEYVRNENNEKLSRPMSSLGYEIVSGSATSTPSSHRVNRNTLRQLKMYQDETNLVTGSQNDNYFIQHPIPRSDLAYSWITGSISSSAMNSLFSYQKSSTDVAIYIKPRSMLSKSDYDPTTSTMNFNFSSSYGFSSWEQIRKHDGQHAKYLRNNNQYSFLREDNKNPESITNITQAPVTMKYMPIKHEVKLTNDPSNTDFEMVSTFANELSFFESQKNVDVESILGLSSEEKETFYDKVKQFYINPDPNLANNPIREVRRVKYSEAVYPIGRYSGVTKTRVRESYDEAAGTGANGLDRQYGKQNNFYHTTKKRSAGAKNSLNYSPTSGLIAAQTYSYDFSTGVPADFAKDATSGVKYDGTAGNYAFVFGDQSSTSVSTRYIQFQNSVAGNVYVKFDVIQGTYSALGLENPDSGENLLIQYRLNPTDPWVLAKLKGTSGTTNDATLLAGDNLFGNDGYDSVNDPAMWSNISAVGADGVQVLQSDGTAFPDTGAEIRIAQTSYSGYQYDNWAIRNLSITTQTVSTEKDHLALFPLMTDGIRSFSLSSSYANNVGELLVDTDESAYGNDPQPSLCFVEYTNGIISGSSGYILTDYVERLTEDISGRKPSEESYDDYREVFRPVLKDGGIIPEFRISEHINEYFEDLNFSRPPANYFTIQGGSTPEGDILSTSDENFFDKHMTTEPMSSVKEIVNEHSDMEISRLKIKCDAIKKLLPYNGFYPVNRTTQLANEMSSSFSANIKGYKDDSEAEYNSQGMQAFAKAMMSPGILFNTIKAGYAVDYPVFTGSAASTTTITTLAQNPQEEFSLSQAPDYRMPFESLYDPKGNIPEDTNIRFTPSYVSSEPLNPSFPYYAKWTGKAKPNFQLAMHNYLAESVDFFLKDGTLNYFTSRPEKEFEEMEADKTYYMDVVLRDNVKMDRFGNYSGYVRATGDSFIYDGGAVGSYFSGSDGYYAVAYAHGEKSESKPNRITIYRNKLDADGWVYLDRCEFTDDSSSDIYRRIDAASGSNEIFVAIGNSQDYSYGVLGSVRVYKFRSGSFDQDYDLITGSLTTPTSSGRKLYAYGTEVKIVANPTGYNLLTSDSAHGSVNFLLNNSGGLGADTFPVTASSNTGLLFLYNSSSANGIKESNIFHNTLPGAASNNSRLGYPGTYDMVYASYTDTNNYNSSSMDGVVIVAGTGRHPAGGTQTGGICMFYSGSTYGTASAQYVHPSSQDGDMFGSVVAVCNNASAPNQNFYFAVSSAGNSSSSKGRVSGSVHLFTGSVYQSMSIGVSDAGDTIREPDGGPKFVFGQTMEFGDTYLTGSGFNATAHQKEFGVNGSFYKDATNKLAWGSTLSLDSSRYENGKENKVLLAIGNHQTSYVGKGADRFNTSGSIFVVEVQGNGFVAGSNNNTNGHLTVLPVRKVPGMDDGYIYGNTGIRSTTAGNLKIISGSPHPYNRGDDILVFSNPRSSDNDYLSTNSSGKAYIFMHTGSVHSGDNSYVGSYDNSSGNEVVTPKFSASLQIDAFFNYKQDGKSYGLPIEYPHDPAYCAYTPPSYYGTSVARISFKPSVSGRYTLEEILSNVDMQTISNIDSDRVSIFSTYDKRNELSELQQKVSMKITSSINLYGKTFDPAMEFKITEGGKRVTPDRASNNVSEDNKRWVISTKYESPILDFSGSDSAHSASYTSHRLESIPAHNFTADDKFLAPRGMWTSYGYVPTNDKGIFLELKESFSPDVYQDKSKNIGSLIGSLGFTADAKKLGNIRESKEISEAICLIPYIKSRKSKVETNMRGTWLKEYLSTDRPLVNVPRFDYKNISRYSSDLNLLTLDGARNHLAKRLGFAEDHNLISINKDEFLKQKRTYEDSSGRVAVKKDDSETGEEIPQTSITRMLEGLEKYIVPPHLDVTRTRFDKRSANNPFAMYFVEVNHTLDKDDLTNIWQNISPDIAVNFETSEIELSHDLNKHNFFESSKMLKAYLNKELSFMVFKVKRRAKINYFDTTKDSTDDNRFRFDLKGGTSEVVPEYSYNWPYDFFSLIENVKITMEVELEKPEPPPPPPPPPPKKKKIRRKHVERKLKDIAKPKPKKTKPKFSKDKAIKQQRTKQQPKKVGNPYRTTEVPKKSPPRKPKKFRR